MNNLLNNDLLLFSLIAGTVILISGYYIKSYFYSTVTGTPNATSQFYLTSEELNEMKQQLDRGDQLDQEQTDNLNQTMENILGTEDYNNMNQDLQAIEDEMKNEIERILSEEFPNMFL